MERRERSREKKKNSAEREGEMERRNKMEKKYSAERDGKKLRKRTVQRERRKKGKKWGQEECRERWKEMENGEKEQCRERWKEKETMKKKNRQLTLSSLVFFAAIYLAILKGRIGLLWGLRKLWRKWRWREEYAGGGYIPSINTKFQNPRCSGTLKSFEGNKIRT